MAARIFLRDVAGCLTGQIADLDWDAFRASAARHHGVSDPIDSYSVDIEEAARRWVQSLQSGSGTKDAGRARTRATAHDE